MARKRREEHPIGVGFTTRQFKHKKPINLDYLRKIEPLTENQKKLFEYYEQGKNIFAHGVPGSGKTLILLYNALKEVLNERSPYEKIYLIRSAVSTRNVGYLPGLLEDKIGMFEIPYKNMMKYIFEMYSDADYEMLYGNLKAQGTISFWSTSFIRGVTLDDAVIIVDEAQNLSMHESFSIISRCGLNTKIMFAGDIEQSDLTRSDEKNGIIDFLRIIDIMPSFEKIEFDVDDICRSPLVKEFVIAKKSLGL